MVKLSIVIPTYNSANRITKTLESVKKQKSKDYEIIVIDDCSIDSTKAVAEKYAKVYTNSKNSGPAKSRNVGVKHAKGELVAFIDDDVFLSENWIEEVFKIFNDKKINAVMGKIKIPKSTYLGNSIALLGFPAGGAMGFEKMWRVDKEGFTNRFSTCNFIIRKKIFENIGAFDETFPVAGGEDTEYAYRLIEKGFKIKYDPNLIAYHEPMTSFSKFIKWQFKRGRGNYYTKKKTKGTFGYYFSLRLWSTKNMIKHIGFRFRVITVLLLLFISFVLETAGEIYERIVK